MKRRPLLTAIASTAALSSADSVLAQDDVIQSGAQYFAPLGNLGESETETAIVECTGALCPERGLDTVEKLVASDVAIDDALRRARLAARVLNERQITGAIDESSIASIERKYGQATRYIPLFGSLNNLQDAACLVDDPPTPGQIEHFLTAALAFGVEIGLWYTGAPFKMAWTGTRFVSNRTFLRYANHGCNGCIAFLMSELHWGLRAVPYQLTSDAQIVFLKDQLSELREDTADVDLRDEAGTYDQFVDLDLDEEQLRETIERDDVPLDSLLEGDLDTSFVEDRPSISDEELSKDGRWMPGPLDDFLNDLF